MRKKTGHVKDTEEKLGGARRACKGGRQMVGEHGEAWGSVGEHEGAWGSGRRESGGEREAWGSVGGSMEERGGVFCMKAPGPSRGLRFFSLAAEIFEAGE